MKIKLIVSGALITFGISQLSAQEISGTSLTLSDIKVALYNLLIDTKSAENNISVIKKQISHDKKYGTLKIINIKNMLKREIDNNTKNILLNSKKIKKMENEKILYIDEMKNFIQENSQYLPVKQ